MNVSIKNKIYLSFFLPVFLFIASGVFSIIALNNNRKLAEHISTVTEPSLEGIDNFEAMVVKSKMYTIDWVFLRSGLEDKDALRKIRDADYPNLKKRLNLLSSGWNDKPAIDSLNKIYTEFEQLLMLEKKIMTSLETFEDYNNPVIKLEAERIIKDELLERASSLINALTKIEATGHNIKIQRDKDLERSFMQLKTMIFVRAIIMICIGIFLSLYLTRIIIIPINKIRNSIKDLGKGIIPKIDYGTNRNEIGKMVHFVNVLSEKLQAAATFAHEVGLRNFDIPFKPLSDEDTLGKALIAMRDNIKSGDEKLNQAQHIAKLGSFERDLATGRVYFSDEMFTIFDIDPAFFDYDFQSITKLVHPEDIDYFKKMGKKYLEDHQPIAYECRIVTAKGMTKNISVQSEVVLDTDGKVVRTFGIVQDITERKRGEAKLAEEQALLRIIIENIPDQIYVKDTEGRFLHCNMPGAINAGCKSQADIIGKTDFDFFPRESAQHFFAVEQDIMKSGKSLINQEDYVPDKITGEPHWSLNTKVPIKDHSGKMIGLIGINRDITQKKLSEKKVEDVNRELNILFNSIDEVFFSVDMANFKVIQISRTCEKLYGYKQSEFMDNYTLWFDIIHPGDKYVIENEDEGMRRGEQVNNQYRIIRKDKIIRWVETKITPTLDNDGNLIRIDGINRDITDRKKAEIALLESQKQIQTIFDAALDAIIIIDEEGKIVKWDSKAELLFGWKEDEVLGMSLTETIIPHRYHEAHERARKHFLETGEGPILSKTVEVRALNKYNHEFDISLSVSPSVISGKNQFIGFIRDITSRKKAETELHNSEERYRQIVETSQEGIWLVDENNRTNFVNKRLCEILGYSTGEMIGKEIFDLMDEKGKKIAAEGLEIKKQGNNDGFDFKFITKEGAAVWTYLSISPVRDDDGKYIGALAMVTDITQRKHDEELLKKSQASLAINNHQLEQKNKELEQFAYVASHDLQEPLRTTISFVEIFKKQYFGKLDSKADKYLEYITQSSDRMRVLIKDLLDFSRIGINKDLEKVDCNILLHDVITDLDKAIKDSNADIKSEHLPVISGYTTELKQLFQNLIINSIKFRKKNVPLKINITAQKKNDYWRFAITDNGIGLDQQHSERIFIIFQRLHTRSEYQGSGIGLSHCKKIVELHNGKIWVESTPNEGSTFYFTIHSPKEKINEPKIKLHNAH